MRALDVHFQLMQRLPVRTVLEKPKPPDRPFHSTPEQTLALNARIRALKKTGLKNVEIAARLRTTPSTVSYHLKGHCSTAAKAKRRK